MSKKLFSVVIALVVIVAALVPVMTASASPAITNPVAESSLFNKVTNGWYVSNDGGFKFNIGGWSYYGSYGITLIESSSLPTNCVNISIYSADDASVFGAKTKTDFENVLQQTITTFRKTSVGNNDFTMYYAETDQYENYVFQANGCKYFINFIWAGASANITTREAFKEFAADVMDTIVIANDPPVQKYSVTYNVDGELYAKEEYKAGTAITIKEAPVKEGYDFSGWDIANTFPSEMPAENIVVTGTFTPSNPNTGDVSPIVLISIVGIAALALVVIAASKRTVKSK